MSPAEWIEVRAVLDRPLHDWSVFADAFERHGCPGSLMEEAPPSITGYVTATASASAAVEDLRRELTRLGAVSIEVRVIEELDWGSRWREFFRPVRVGRVFVRPSWEPVPLGPNDVEVVLDPGQAFGTGDHPTTRLCLDLMQGAGIAGKRVLDLGCGSGILGIAARKLGADRVMCADVESVAVDVARENARVNGVDVACVLSDGFAGVPDADEWDLIVANLISATLIRLAPEARKRLAPKGRWIVSGVIEDNWPEVRTAIEREGLELDVREGECGWVAATFAAE